MTVGYSLGLVQVELRKKLQMLRAYYVELVADQIVFILGFLILTGIFELVTDGKYSQEAQLASLVGYLTWRVAGGCMRETTGSIAQDAKWGTLEQVWLSGNAPALILFARSAVLLIFYTVRVLVIGLIVILLLRIPIHFLPGAILIYVLTLGSAFGLAFAIAGLHLVYKNVDAITFALASTLLFLTGAVSPLDGVPVLYPLSRVLPLSIGIDLLRMMLVQGVSLTELLATREFYYLLANLAAYLGAGLLILRWAQRRVLADGSLGHY
jgi:ABC-2 type transport system permease protein